MSKSINIVFIKQCKEEKNGTIYIRTIEGRTIKKKSLSIKLSEKDWCKFFNPNTKRFREDKKFPSSELYNNRIETFLKELNNVQNDIELLPDEKKSFIEYWNFCLKNFTNHGTIIKHQVIQNKLQKFLSHKKKSDLLFTEITPIFLKELRTYLITVKDPKRLSENSVNHYLKVIRSIINQAMSDDYFTYVKNPFNTLKFNSKNTSKDILTEKEIILLINTDIKDEVLDNTRNMFLFQIFSNGMRVSDLFLLKWKSIVKGRIEYNMFKTGNPINVPININTGIILNKTMKNELFSFESIKEKQSAIYKGIVNKKEYGLITLKQVDELISTTLKKKSGNPIKDAISNFEKVSDKNSGSLIDYKGYQIKKTDSKVKELINIRETLISEANSEFISKLFSNISKMKNDFMFPVLTEKVFMKIDKNKEGRITLNLEQYKNIKHNTIVYNRRLKTVKELCGIETNLTSHVARHTFTNLLLRMKDVNLYDVSQTLGHSSIKTTENYIKSGFNTEKLDYLNDKMSSNFPFSTSKTN